MIAANAPDVDMLSYVRGEYFALATRRGITHGWPALLLLPFLVTAGVLAWDRWVRLRRDPDALPAKPGPVLLLSALGVVTHPALDWMNTYGMRWTLPFDSSWSYGDALFIIDPWIWLALGGTVILSTRPGRGGLGAWGFVAVAATLLISAGAGLVPAAVWLIGVAAVVALFRAEVRPSPRAIAATAGAVVVYIVAMVGADLLAAGHVRAAARDAGITVRDVMVAPLPANPFAAEVEILTPDAYVPGTHRWLRAPRVELHPAGAVPLLAKPAAMSVATAEDVLAAAREHPDVRNYLVWSRYAYAQVTVDGDGWSVRFSDARYDTQGGAGGLAGLSVYVPDPGTP